MKQTLILIVCGFASLVAASTTIQTMHAQNVAVSISAVSSNVVKEIDVIVFAGQSNALGYPNETNGYGSTGTSLPESLQGNQDGIRSWNYTYANWDDEPLHPDSSVYWGAEITAMNEIYTAYSNTICLVKVAYGSMSLYGNWQKGSNQYVRLTNAMTIAKTTLENEGYTVKWRQFWWNQGENDSVVDLETAEAYEDNFRTFWTNLCADTGMSTNTTVVIAPLADHYGAIYANTVRSNQVAIGNWTNGALIVTDDLPFYSGVHYSAESYMTMGLRYAEVYTNEFGATPTMYLKSKGTLLK